MITLCCNNNSLSGNLHILIRCNPIIIVSLVAQDLLLLHSVVMLKVEKVLNQKTKPQMDNYPPIVKPIIFNDLNDFFEQVLNFNGINKIDLSNYIFRGHSNDSFKLIPSALRIENKEIIHKLSDVADDGTDSESSQGFVERNLLQKFYNKSDLQSLDIHEIELLRNDNAIKVELCNNALPDYLHKLAGLAQHYGVITRLLDWTNNINIALYFAINVNEESDIIESDFLNIWCLSQQNVGLLNSANHIFPGELYIFRPQYKCIPNLAAQQGVFTLWNHNNYIENVDRRPLDQIVYEAILKKGLIDLFKNKEPFFYLFKIPKKFSRELYRYLSEVNYTASRLFPGYYGVAKEIKQDGVFR